jgi:Dolichyl-phosphate-mannose-protein mannosyltransferase
MWHRFGTVGVARRQGDAWAHPGRYPAQPQPTHTIRLVVEPGDAPTNNAGYADAPLPEPATKGLITTAVAIAALLIAFSARYGYHRDELYFLACGRHLAWGYPDQPPLTPLIARIMSDISATSLVVFRLPSALATAATVYFAGLTARELGADKTAQVFAAAGVAVTNVVLATGHLVSTTTYDLTAWAAISWLAVRAVRRHEDHLWLVIGVVAGVGLLDSDLVAFLIAGLAVGVLIAGPRDILRSPWLWAGAVVMLALWAPYLVWQGRHGWPELTIAHAIANGSSGTSAPRWQIVPFQFVLSGVFLAPVWVIGLWRFARAPELRWCRAVAWAYLVLVLAFLVTGGKPYYLSGMLPLTMAAGAPSVISWVRRGTGRAWVPPAAIILSLVGIVIDLPVLPLAALHKSPVVAVNYDAGETVAWPTYTAQIAAVYRRVPASQRVATIVLGSNYGESGAVDRYGRPLGLPNAYGVQNAFYLWGPPPATATQAVAIGFDRSDLTPYFSHVTQEATLDNHLDVDNDEQDEPIWLASGRRAPWTTIWPKLRDYG